MTSTIIPPVDLAPGMPSRVVTISATDVTEGGKSLEGQMVRFALSDTLDVSSGGDVIAKTQAEVVLDANGEGSIRLPVYDDAVKTWCGDPDWVILVTATWGSQKAIRVPAGTSSIALSELPPVRPLRGREKQWAITGASVTVTEGAQWGATVGLSGGVLGFNFTVPPAATAYWRGTLTGTADANTITDPGAYGNLGTLLNGPPGEGTGILTVSEMAAGGATSLVQNYQGYASRAVWTRNRGGSGVWGSWTRIDGRLRDPIAVTAAADAAALEPGVYLVSDPSLLTGLPADAGPGQLLREGHVDTYIEVDQVERRWERRYVGGLWRAWATVRSEMIAVHSLTRPLGIRTETVSSRSVRIPFTVPVRARRWRLVFRNANYRSNVSYPGAVTMRYIAFGRPVRNAEGELTSSFTANPALFHADVAIPDLAEEWAASWSSQTLEPGEDYMISYGYLTNGTDVTLSMGGGWRTDYNPDNAALKDDGTAVATDRQPFDVRIEYVTDDNVLSDLMIGDSISSGSNASIPVHEAPIMIAGRTSGRAVNLHGFGGAAFGEWGNGAWADPESMKWVDVVRYGRSQRAFIMLGNNDVHAGDDLTTIKSNFTRLATILKERMAVNVIGCTVTPRSAWPGTAKESVRQQFNDWLRSYPVGIVGVADTARAVEDSTGHAPRADYVTADGIHFNTAGSTALANAILDTRVHSEADDGDWASAITALNDAAQ